MLFFTGVFNSFTGFASLFVSATLFVARLDENYKADKRTSQNNDCPDSDPYPLRRHLSPCQRALRTRPMHSESPVSGLH